MKDEEKLWEKVHASNVLGHISFVLPGRSGRKAREVKQELRNQRITLPGRAGVTLTFVEAYEVQAPADV
ncbi:hypothetical protein [Paraburkholderia sp. MM5384-R2]|uniref:hypothetical protein n=1 Tax=Paraburkholderia sp. MM5384-R2 TaxID=2723097 RepID=UPI0017D56241|nr:hypothetical protein [Paraburkholderia sp. MM5384-R2]